MGQLWPPRPGGFEATGNYHRAIAYHLAAAGFEMKLVSSVSLARTRQALHNNWDKNDPKDAQITLHMMEMGTRNSTTTHWHAATTTFMSCPKPMTSSLNSRCPSSGFFEQMWSQIFYQFAAIAYTLIETAEMNKVNPEACLAWVL